MGFATEPPFCMAYPLSFADRDDPMQMTFQHPCNHPCSFTADVLLVHQLLAQDCTQCEHEEDGCRRCLLIPRGVHFSEDLLPLITVPQAHAEPFPDPQSGIVPPFFNVGPFASTDTLFTSAAGDLDLFTAMEISALVRVGFLKPPIAGKRDTSAAPVEPASSSGKRDHRDSPSRHRCPVSMAAGSHDDLDKSECEHEAVANDFTGISTPSAVSPQAEMCHMGLNVVELLTLVFPLSVLTPKNTDLREGGLANASVLGCQSVLFHVHFYFLLRLPIVPLWVPSVVHRWI